MNPTELSSETDPELTIDDTPEPQPAPPATPGPDAKLADMVAIAITGRMSPAFETQTADLLRQALLGGKPEITEALDAIGKLPWPVSVNGLNAAWPEMKPYGRRLFISGMKGPAFAGEIGRRIRLSITRGLVKVDEPQAAKWACAIAAEMLGEDGILATRDRQSFFNVLVGKGKPWLLRLPLEGLKDADVASLLAAAVSTIFTGGCPPFTQSALLQWMIKIEKVDLLNDRAQQAVAQAIRKWPGRLLRDFKVLPENLPPTLALAFSEKNARRGQSETAANEKEPTEDNEITTGNTDEVAPPTATETDENEPVRDHEDEEEDDEDEEEEDDLPQSRRDSRGSRDSRPKHPPYVSPGQPNRPSNQPSPTGPPNRGERSNGPTFDPVSTLRQLDNFIRQQSQQLAQARTQLRQRDDEQKRGGGRRGGGRGRYGSHGGDGVWPDTTPPEDNESLRRYIVQIEGINNDLRARLEDLAQDGERRAESLTADDGSPLGERQQLVNFLALKLAKDHADFQKLSHEPDDEVFREHYRIVAQNVFEILAAEGIHPKPPEVPIVELG